MSSTSPDDGVHEMVDAAQSFVRRVYPQHPNWTAAGLGTRPHVTLTFAQSVDAKVAGPEKKQLALSGRESMLMTHWCVLLLCGPLKNCRSTPRSSLALLNNHISLRTVHDGILVGVGTLTNDNPQLNGASPLLSHSRLPARSTNATLWRFSRVYSSVTAHTTTTLLSPSAHCPRHARSHTTILQITSQLPCRHRRTPNCSLSITLDGGQERFDGKRRGQIGGRAEAGAQRRGCTGA